MQSIVQIKYFFVNHYIANLRQFTNRGPETKKTAQPGTNAQIARLIMQELRLSPHKHPISLQPIWQPHAKCPVSRPFYFVCSSTHLRALTKASTHGVISSFWRSDGLYAHCHGRKALSGWGIIATWRPSALAIPAVL